MIFPENINLLKKSIPEAIKSRDSLPDTWTMCSVKQRGSPNFNCTQSLRSSLSYFYKHHSSIDRALSLPYLEVHIQDAVRFVHDEKLERLEVEAARVLQMVHQTTRSGCEWGYGKEGIQ